MKKYFMKMFMFKVLCIMKIFTKMFMFMHLHENDTLSTNIFHRYVLTVLRITRYQDYGVLSL